MQTFFLASAIIALIPAQRTVSHGAESAAGLEEVVVTGTRKEGMSPTETLSPIDVISRVADPPGVFSLTESLTQIAPH